MLVGVDMGGSHVAVALASSDGQISRRDEVRLDFDPDDAGGNLTRLCQALDGFLADLSADASTVLTIGVPATIYFERGLVGEAPFLGWKNLPLKAILEERYHLPVLIDNDVNLASLGEATFGAGQGARNLVCIMIGTNIGDGIILDGALYRGSNGAAGEIGWMVPDPVLLGQPCQVYGGLEAFAGGQGIANQTQALLRQEPETKSAMLEAVRGDIEAIKAEHVFEAARHQDKAARRVLDKALDYLAVSVANIVSLLDPDLIIIGGGVARSGDFLIEAIKPRFEGMLLQYPPLVLSTLGDEAVLYGALSLGQSYLQKQR